MREVSPIEPLWEWVSRAVTDPTLLSFMLPWAGILVLVLLGVALALPIHLRSLGEGHTRQTLAPTARRVGWAAPVICVLILVGIVATQKLVNHGMVFDSHRGQAVKSRQRAVDRRVAARLSSVVKRHRSHPAPLLPSDSVVVAPSPAEPGPPEMPTTVVEQGPPAAPSTPSAPAQPGPTQTAPTQTAPTQTAPTQTAPTQTASTHIIPRVENVGDVSPPAGALPAWVHQPRVDSADVTLVVVEGGFAENEEAAVDAVAPVAAAVIKNDFARSFPETGGKWTPPEAIVRAEAVRKTHVERVDRKTLSSATPFHVFRAYQQVELSPNVRQRIFKYWRDEIVAARLRTLGGLAGLLTLTFVTAAAYFRLDDRTRGAYHRRLKLAAVMVIAAGGIAATWL